MRITGNTVVVTGGGTGIGRGMAEALHRSGNKVIVAGRREESLAAVANANHGQIGYLRLDLADPASIDRFSAELTDQYPNIDVLINNAGVQQVEDLTRGEVQAAEAAVAVNLLGPIRLTAALLPTLLAQPRATIINVTSSLAFVPNAAIPSYSATKAALHSYTQSLRFQLRHTDVAVIEIIPSQVKTGILGERNPSPTAMSVDDFVYEVMTALAKPQCNEIVPMRAETLRYAERDGVYQARFDAVNPANSLAGVKESDRAGGQPADHPRQHHR